MLAIAALLIIVIGIVHSLLGEKYILQRLFRQPLPKLFGNDQFTKMTLRFAWHITSVAWFGFATQLILLYRSDLSGSMILIVIATTFSTTALIALIASRGKHLSWLVFAAVAILCFLSVSMK